MPAEPEQVEQFVRWIHARVAEDPGFLPRVRQSIATAAFSPSTRERLDREIDRLEKGAQPGGAMGPSAAAARSKEPQGCFAGDGAELAD